MKLACDNKSHTHCDPVYLGVIGFVVVAVKGSFSDCECSLDCKRICVVDGSSSEMLVDVVHSRNDHCDAGGPS
jgi:hypothetical protein